MHSFSWIATERFRRVQQMRWVTKFRTIGFSLKKRLTGRSTSARTPDNIDRVCAAVEISPCTSARKQADALNMSDRSVKQISQFKIHFYLFIQIGYCSAIKKKIFFSIFFFGFVDYEKKICRTNG